MKFQTNHIAKFALIAAIGLAAVGVVGAKSPSSITNPSVACPTSQTVSPQGRGPCPEPTPELTPEPAPAPILETPALLDYEKSVTFNDTDLGVAMFKSTDADGNPTINFYKLETGTSTITYLLSLSLADIALYIANPPAVNTLLKSAEGVSVYVLTTGEIQVNAGPDAEGKTHVKIFNGIPWTQVYGYTIDPVK